MSRRPTNRRRVPAFEMAALAEDRLLPDGTEPFCQCDLYPEPCALCGDSNICCIGLSRMEGFCHRCLDALTPRTLKAVHDDLAGKNKTMALRRRRSVKVMTKASPTLPISFKANQVGDAAQSRCGQTG